ncbi:hypothetical protein, partial [Lacinutrix himadriensis]|uniref:hypothetical protein n=1 Tax=Lacinutrix himadriensis TaxID=641549 RepID=UPI0006E1F4A7
MEEAFEIVANSVTTIENCHFVQITVPEDIDSCFNFTVGGLGDGEYPLETGINTMENNENGGLTLLVYNLNNATMPCAKKEVEIVCCPTCEEAFETVASSVTTIENCHFVEIMVPQNEDNCFNFTVDMGSGEIPLEEGLNTFENNGNGQLTMFVYDVNNPEDSCMKEEVAITCCPTCE